MEVQAGDIIGFSGDNLISAGLCLATYGIPFWSLSHVGIIGEHSGKLLLFESTTLNEEPCEITGKRIKGSQAHALDSRVALYNGRIWHYPLYRPLFSHERRRLNSFLIDTIGRNYDMIGAFRSGGLGFSWLESKLREQDLHSLFCSEWCAAAHADIGILTTDNGSKWNPSRLVRTERHNGILRKPVRLK